jgi:hypothetical protein
MISRLWSAVAERSGDTALDKRLGAQSKSLIQSAVAVALCRRTPKLLSKLFAATRPGGRKETVLPRARTPANP